MLIFMMMALGLNIVVGYAGLLDLGYVAFYAMGAYTAGLVRVAALLGRESALSGWGRRERRIARHPSLALDSPCDRRLS